MYIYNIISPVLYFLILRLWIPKCKKRNAVLTILLLIQLIIVASVRSYGVGTDTLNYKQYYEEIYNTNIYEYFLMYRLEPLYILYNKLLSLISSNPRLLLIANSIIIYPVIVKTFYKYSRIVWFSFFLYFALGFFNMSLNISRQWLAISIIISSYPYIVNRKPYKFFFRVLVASLFHCTAILFVITYPLLKYKISFKYLVTMLACCTIFSVILLPTILGFVLGRFYSIYEMSSQGGYGMLGLLLITTVGGLILKPKVTSDFDSLLYNMMIIACVLQIISLSFSIFVRVVLYWQFIMTLFIPMVVARQTNLVFKNILVFSIVVLASLYYFGVVTASSDLQGTVPYSFE